MGAGPISDAEIRRKADEERYAQNAQKRVLEGLRMTTPGDEALIERLARAAAKADGYDPDHQVSATLGIGGALGAQCMAAWKLYLKHARLHLAMQREYERAMQERHEAWMHEMIATAPKQNDNCDDRSDPAYVQSRGETGIPLRGETDD